MIQKEIEALLLERIGLSVEAVGSDVVLKAIQCRMNVCGQGEEGYLALLKKSEEEWQCLVEAVVIPETWFFRNKRAFSFLVHHAKSEGFSGSNGRVLRILSVPSSTGEEPYSITMALSEAGMERGRFHVDAVDISHKALTAAKLGLYGPGSFRGGDLAFRDQYFDLEGEDFRLKPSVQASVRFLLGNLLDPEFMSKNMPYDVIFCRNLLIYLTDSARTRALATLDRLLSRAGIVFVGHAERHPFITSGFEPIRQPGVFAFRRPLAQRLNRGPIPIVIPPRFERRSVGTGPTSSLAGHGAAVPRKEGVGAPPLQYVGRDRRQIPAEEVKWLDRARLLADQGHLEEAVDLCDRCLQENGAHVRALFLKGLVCLAMKDEARAEECFNKAVYLDPHDPQALRHLALVLEHQGEKTRAAQILKRLKRLLARGAKA